MTHITPRISVLGMVVISAAAVIGPAMSAAASDGSRAQIITRDGVVTSPGVVRVPVDPNRPEAAQLVFRQVAEPAAVVSRELASQPVLPHLAEVKVGGTTILVDPEVDYRRAVGGIDRNHTIRRAQRIHREVMPSRVIRSPLADENASAERAAAEPQPRAIFLRPDLLGPPPAPQQSPTAPSLPDVQHPHDAPQPRTAPIPHVPAQPRERLERVAQAE